MVVSRDVCVGDGWMDGWMDGLVGGQMDGLMDEWTWKDG